MDISFKLVTVETAITETISDNAYEVNTGDSITIKTYPRDKNRKRCYIAIKITDSVHDYNVFVLHDNLAHINISRFKEYYIIKNPALYQNPGRSQVVVFDQQGSLLWKGSILVLPSNFTQKQFIHMLNEIMAIKFELLYASDRRKVQNKVFARRVNHDSSIFDGLREDLKKIYKVLKAISHNPHRKGTIKTVNVSKYDMRAVSPEMIQQYVENPFRQSYKGKKLVDSISNYENTIIAQILEKLSQDISGVLKRYDMEVEAYDRSLYKRMINLNNRTANAAGKSEFISALNKQKDIFTKSQKHGKAVLEEIQDILHSILSLKLFSKIKHKRNKSIKLRLTQVFSNDINYHAIYMLLKKINDYQLEVTLIPQGEEILLEKVHTLYEYWVLMKIIEYLTRLGFRHNLTAREILDIVWTNKHEGRGKEQKIIFIKDEIELILFYDTGLSQSLKYLKYRAISPQITMWDLRPDYLFIIRKGNTERIFILDAKYRLYRDMPGGMDYWYNKDIKEVAKDKYIDRIEEEYGISISASFIVHTDAAPNDNLGMCNPNRYLGKYVTYDVENDMRFEGVLHMEDGHDRDDYKYGSFYMVPNNGSSVDNDSNANLNKFFDLIFEFYMDEWREYCWQCGAKLPEDSIQPHTTRGGFRKYHITCKNCGSFVVKNHCSQSDCNTTIIKHDENYFIEKATDKWYLRCPRCGG